MQTIFESALKLSLRTDKIVLVVKDILNKYRVYFEDTYKGDDDQILMSYCNGELIV